MELTEKIRNKILSGQITISELARILGIARKTIYSRLKGETEWKKLEVEKLAKLN